MTSTNSAKVKKQGLQDNDDNDNDDNDEEDDENEEEEDRVELVELGGKRDRGRGTKPTTKAATKGSAKSGGATAPASGAAFLQKLVANAMGKTVGKDEVGQSVSYPF